MKESELLRYLEEKRTALFNLEKDVFPRTRLVGAIRASLSTDLITVLVGMRRAGKSYALRLLAHKLLTSEGAQRDQFFSLNFEDPDLISFSAETAVLLRSLLRRTNGTPRYLFCDEVQALAGADRILQSFQDIPNLYIVVTGSNATLLSEEISTLLTGRHRDLFVPTLRYQEYRERSTNTFRTYMSHTGFPYAARNGDDDIVRQYFNDIVVKDIFARYRIHTQKDAILRLYTYVLSNIKNQFSISDIHEAIPSIKSEASIAKFLHYLEQSFIIVPLRNYHYALKRRYRDKTKYYTLDNGFISTVGDYVLDPADTLFENAVFKELYARFGQQVFFLRRREKKYDVDFFVPVMSRPILINATLGFQNKQTKDREVSSLFAAMHDLEGAARAYVVTLDENLETIERDGKTVTILGIEAFLEQLESL